MSYSDLTQRIEDNKDWDSFLELTGEEKYTRRIQEWGSMAGETAQEMHLDTSNDYTTSIIVVECVIHPR